MTRTQRMPAVIVATVVVLLAVTTASLLWLRSDVGTRPANERPTAASPSETPTARYAYTIPGELVIETGTGSLIRAPGEYRGGRSVFWTDSGNFVVSHGTDSSESPYLTIVNVLSGMTHRFGCDCTAAVPVGTDRIAYVTSARKPYVIDLALGAAPQEFPVTLPDRLQPVEVMASGGETLLLRARPPEVPGETFYGMDEIFSVRSGNSAAEKVAEYHMMAAANAIGTVTPDGVPRFVFSAATDDGRCVDSTYQYFDGSSGQITDLPELKPGAAEKGTWMEVWDLWWDADGKLNATLSTKRCTDALDDTETVQPSLWRLDGVKWRSVDRTPVRGMRILTGGKRLVLKQEREHGNSLYLENAGTSRKLADEVQDVVVGPEVLDPPTTQPAGTVNGFQLAEAGVCKKTCFVSGTVQIEHPAWGRISLVTTSTLSDVEPDANIVAVDAEGTVRWQHWSGGWPLLRFANPATDRTGHLFFNFNPGRHNGVIVLAPSPDGFEDFETLPKPGEYAARFYGAKLVDTDKDGRYEVDRALNDCDPSCAEGTVNHLVYRWNGRTYAP
ncbi:hypothetical protein [Micromonospora aurantiaca (nom. illeg.)]|uniref:hypothetical protein n=1 Tax=Micromonospora aurantiaca (nom. illeg.) TaxID=47850 RepID=UPI003EC12AA7